MAVDSVVANAASQVTGAIQQAARSTGTSFEYLLTTARIESNLNPAAKAPTTSASGLYQFIDQTWLATVKEAGPSHGLGRYAAAIVPTLDGHFDVPDPAMRDAIMKLRADPTASAVMAGAFTRTNSALLSSTLGRAPTEGELYIAHFLGRDGATKLVSAAASTPQPAAADLFPQAASANKSIFYDRLGRARSASDVYGILTSRYEGARDELRAEFAGGCHAKCSAPCSARSRWGYASLRAGGRSTAAARHQAAVSGHVYRPRATRCGVSNGEQSVGAATSVDPSETATSKST